MKKSLWNLIPKSFRRRGGGVVVTIFLRALLNFLGLAMLLPVLLLILEGDNLHANPWLERLWLWGGFSQESHFVWALLASVVGIILLKSLLMLWLFRVERNFIYDLYSHLSRRLYISYFRRGLGFVKQQNSAILSRNVNGVTFAFVAGVLRPIAAMSCEVMLFMLLFGALTLYHAAAAAVVLLIFLPTLVGYYYLVRRRLNRYGEQENQAQREKARTVIETFRGYAEVELNRAFPLMLDRFDRAMEDLVEVQRKNATLGMLPSILTEVGLTLGMVAMVAWSLTDGGDQGRILFGVFAVAALRLLPSVRGLMSGWSTLKYNRYTIDTLLEAGIEEGADSEEQPHHERLHFEHEIRLDDLSFHFDDAPGKEILEHLSLTIRKGERIGFRGASGRGKTTLFQLLLGLYEPTAGAIWIDGQRLDASTRRAWQNTLGYVSQSVFLIDSTFAANIALGCRDEEIDRERVAQALKAARLDEFVEGLQKGMDTPIGECGCRLSGGQRQRIGIARALYNEASVLLFDEATSALDSETEREINHSIEELTASRRDLTILVIAHRESSLGYCDRIIDL